MKLIDKDALIAEIERRIEKFREQKDYDSIVKTNTYKGLLSFIDTLEVKEVDLEKELDSMITPELKKHKALPSLMDVAKHFFELGVNASNPLTDADLDFMQDDYVSLLESRGMKREEAVIASVSYANGVNDVLKRFKEQKGERYDGRTETKVH